MKKSFKSMQGKTAAFRCRIIMMIMIMYHIGSGISAQEFSSVSGRLIDPSSHEGLPFANIILYKGADPKIADGVNSDTAGYFAFRKVPAGNYRLQVSMIGYKKVTRELNISAPGHVDAGTILMEESTTELGEVEVTGDRIKGKADRDKTSYFITKKMADISSDGMDILKQIPGIQVDLMQNISLEGSRSIMILVNGKERDQNYVSQINPKEIDRIEIMTGSATRYDAEVTGAINIILKKEPDSGISGRINAEIPASCSFLFLHPSGGLDFNYKKIQISASYAGELIYGDVHDNTSRVFPGSTGISETNTNQCLKQKYWSHRINLGIDYLISSKDQIQLYGFYNPYTKILEGVAEAWTRPEPDTILQTHADYRNQNAGLYSSLHYRHEFNKPGNEFDIEVSNYHLETLNSSVFRTSEYESTPGDFESNSRPRQTAWNLKLDGNFTLKKDLTLSLGAKMRWQQLNDATLAEFRYDEQVFAGYAVLGGSHSKYDWNAGLRIEYAASKLPNIFHASYLTVLPSGGLNIRLSARENLKISLGRSVYRPTLYMLNPCTVVEDPFTVREGNPFLRPEYHNSLFIEYSRQFKSNYIAARLFFLQATDAINKLTVPAGNQEVEVRYENLGTIQQAGIQLTGSVSAGKMITFTPYVRVFDQYTAGNSLASGYSITPRHQFVVESSLAAVMSFRHEMALSVNVQYNSPKNNIQDNYFCGALYFLTFEKTFRKNLKTALECGLPFTKTFTYEGSDIDNGDFHSSTRNDIQVPGCLLLVRLSYQFTSGKKQAKMSHATEEPEPGPSKVF